MVRKLDPCSSTDKELDSILHTLLTQDPDLTPKIHEFRTIHLIESDLNFIVRKIWGREFMIYNECADGFHKVLLLDIIWYYGEPYAMVDNDATVCYDRILPYLPSGSFRSLLLVE